MAENPLLVSVDPTTKKIRENHLPERLSPESLEETFATIGGDGGSVRAPQGQVNLLFTEDPDATLHPGDLAFYYAPRFKALETFADGLTGWTPRGDATTQWSTVTDADATDGHAARLSGIPVGQSALLVWDDPELQAAQDVEVLIRGRSLNPSYNGAGVMVRGSGPTPSGQGGYRAVVTSGRAAVYKHVEGVLTLLWTGVAKIDPTEWFMLRLRVTGDTIQVKLWPASGVEPAEWENTLVDTTVPHGGYVALAASGGSSSLWDTVAVALDGATAVIP